MGAKIKAVVNQGFTVNYHNEKGEELTATPETGMFEIEDTQFGEHFSLGAVRRFKPAADAPKTDAPATTEAKK